MAGADTAVDGYSNEIMGGRADPAECNVGVADHTALRANAFCVTITLYTASQSLGAASAAAPTHLGLIQPFVLHHMMTSIKRPYMWRLKHQPFSWPFALHM